MARALIFWLVMGAVLLLLPGCATRKLESCLASVVMLGPGLVTLDCRAPSKLVDD